MAFLSPDRYLYTLAILGDGKSDKQEIGFPHLVYWIFDLYA
jgi:hypothetical protein